MTCRRPSQHSRRRLRADPAPRPHNAVAAAATALLPLLCCGRSGCNNRGAYPIKRRENLLASISLCSEQGPRLSTDRQGGPLTRDRARARSADSLSKTERRQPNPGGRGGAARAAHCVVRKRLSRLCGTRCPDAGTRGPAATRTTAINANSTWLRKAPGWGCADSKEAAGPTRRVQRSLWPQPTLHGRDSIRARF
jgi:hypothetical protein